LNIQSLHFFGKYFKPVYNSFMETLTIIALVLAGYFFVVFFVLRLVVPFMGFSEPEVPKQIPDEMVQMIKTWEAQASKPEDFLQNVFEFVRKNWWSDRFKTILKFPLAFRSDINQIWHERGYAHCTTANYVLFVLLVNSKFFKPGEIRFRQVFLNFFIHQYLQVRVGDRWLDVDPGGSNIGKFGLNRHASGFR
jgi:hypothetical protein